MDPGRLLADYVAEQGEGGQPAGLFGHTLVHLVQKVLRGRHSGVSSGEKIGRVSFMFN